jgi:chromosome segregation ATPase
MNKRTIRNLLVLLLVSSSVFLVFRYISSLKESVTALENQKQNLLQELEKEKASVQRLTVKNTGLKNHLKGAHKRLNKSFTALGTAQEKLEKLKAQFSILKAENSALLEERDRITGENEAMKMKMNSVDELKKAIRELKRQAQKEGNRGFLIKDGQLTSSVKIKIEVNPAQIKNNERNTPAVISK